MKTEFFISRRILSKTEGNFSRPIVRIAVVSISLGLTVMFVAIAVLTGFQKQIREKVIGFGSHIQITHYDENASTETSPISANQDFIPKLKNTKGIRHIQVYATKAGIIKTDEDIQGIILKGIGPDYDSTFFRNRIIEGSLPKLNDTGRSGDVAISLKLASMLMLKKGDPIRMYFISGENTIGRKFRISGIYETGLEEFDKIYVICDINQIRKLNNWNKDDVGGFEVMLDNFDDIDRLGKYVYKNVGFSLDAKTIKELYPQIFDWLDLQDVNVLIILILMTLVAGITMISTLLILILERTGMIGILKALGMSNTGIRRVFLLNSAYIIGQGLIIGNITGLGLCLLQLKYGLVTLSQESYYVSKVPVNLDLVNILILNAATAFVCVLMLVVPSLIVTRISPVKAIRFS